MPTLSTFRYVLNKFDFKSPLNFIMLSRDFERFYKIFHNGMMLSKYMAHIFLDSLFSLTQGHAEEKIETALELKKSFEAEIHLAIDLLTNYDHIVEHDDLDCENSTTLTTSEEIKCHTRKYLATFLSLGVIFIIAYLMSLRVIKG